MDDREDQIEDAYARTFTWILPTVNEDMNEQLGSEFLEWIKSENSPSTGLVERQDQVSRLQ
jgi:hypothetical protein